MIAQPSLWDRLRGKAARRRKETAKTADPAPAPAQTPTGPSTRPLRWSEKPAQRDDLATLGPVRWLCDGDPSHRYATWCWQHYGAHAGVLLIPWERCGTTITEYYEAFVEEVVVLLEPVTTPARP